MASPEVKLDVRTGQAVTSRPWAHANRWWAKVLCSLIYPPTLASQPRTLGTELARNRLGRTEVDRYTRAEITGLLVD